MEIKNYTFHVLALTETDVKFYLDNGDVEDGLYMYNVNIEGSPDEGFVKMVTDLYLPEDYDIDKLESVTITLKNLNGKNRKIAF